MPVLRLAYTTQFLIALIAIFVLWSQVGGQSHLDLMPWYLKLGLGAGAAFATVKATAAAVGQDKTWNAGSLKWFGIVIALLIGCGLASYYVHVYGESDEEDQQDSQTSSSIGAIRCAPQGPAA
jgi:Na+/glutamate symporter